MKIKMLLLTLPLSLSVYSQSSYYQDAKKTLATAPASIQKVIDAAPKTYSFKSQFDNTKSSVSFTGQTFRQVLIADFKSYMSKMQRGGYFGEEEEVLSELNSYYKYSSSYESDALDAIYGEAEFNISARSLSGSSMDIEEGFLYNDIQSPGKNLYGKIAGIDNPLRRGSLKGVQGYKTPNDYVSSMFKEFSVNATSGKSFLVDNGSLPKQRVKMAGVTEDGRDLSQLTQKLFHSAISFSQATGDYLSTSLSSTKGLNADNVKPYKAGKSFTSLEHFYDEGFGYFGAARDFLLYSDKEVYSGGSRDTNNDGVISIKKEMNLGISKNTSRMDLTAKNGKTNFSNEAMSSFVAARYLVAKKPAGYKKYVVAKTRVALGAWEQTLGAVVVHYINKTVSQLEAYGTQKYLFTNLAKFWSEMKGYSLAFQFNPESSLSDSNFDQMSRLLQDRPVLHTSGNAAVKKYVQDLLKARAILKKSFGFSSENVQAW